MYNLQAIHNKAHKRARYIENGPEYKTARKDGQPHALKCDCKVCLAYLEAIKQVNPTRYAAMMEKREA